MYFVKKVKRFFSNLVNGFLINVNRVIGIDLGTVNTLIYTNVEGLVLNQASVVAYIDEDGKRNEYLHGDKAKHMFGKTPFKVEVVAPLVDGVVADFQMAEAMIMHFIKDVIKSNYHLIRPKIVVGVPFNATSVERQAIQNVIQRSGASEVYLVYESMAAAIGCDLPINEPRGTMIVDIGGGTTEISVVSLGGIITGRSIRVGGNKIDNTILEYIKTKYDLLIGIITAEQIKMKLAIACFKENDKVEELEIRGRDINSGTPKAILLTQKDIHEAISPILAEILAEIKNILRLAPPELASDVVDRGIVLCGGGANIKNFDHMISKAVGLPVFKAHKPELSTINGIAKITNNIKKYMHVLFQESN